MRVALERDTLPLKDFIAKFRGRPRVSGTAVYMTGRTDVVPVALLHNLKHNKVVHERIVLLNVSTEHSPRIEPEGRLTFVNLSDNYHSLSAHYGFMEQPDVPRALTDEKGDCALTFDFTDTSFFVGHLTITVVSASRWRRVRTHVFKFMHRNALPARIPPGRVVELGGQIEI